MSSATANDEPIRVGVAPLAGARRTAAFATVMLAFVLDITDSTIVNVGLPTIGRDLGAGAGTIQWIVAGYFLSFAVLLITGGRLGDLYGYRRMFLGGVGSFTAASVACGLAPSGMALVACRVAQGAAAAIMAPQVIALVQLLFSPVERIGKLAAFGIVGGVAAIGGPILGGLLIAADVAGLGWRPIFLVNAPVGLAALAAGWWLLPEGRSPHPLRPDPAGSLLLALALVTLLWPLVAADTAGLGTVGIVSLAAAPVVLLLFWRHAIARTRSRGSALIAPELFAERTFVVGLILTLVFQTATGGYLLVLSLILQRQLGLSALQTALVHIPFGVGVMVGIGVIGRGVRRFGRGVLAAGAAGMALGCGGFALGVARAALPLILVALALAGVGMGTVVGPLTPVTLARVDRGHAGVAGATQGAVQQIGGALGCATVGSLYFAGAGSSVTRALSEVVVLLALTAILAFTLPRTVFPQEHHSN